MCEPFTIAAATIAVAGAAYTAYGQYQEGQYQQGVANNNAKLAEDQSAIALQRGAVATGVQRMKGGQEAGAARAAVASSGVDLQSGSPLDVISDGRMLNELDAQTAKNNAARDAWGYSVQAVNDRAEGTMAARRGRYAAFGTLLGGAAQAAGIGAAYARPMPQGGTGGTTAGAVR